jgi:hypothetical protein
MDADFDLGEPTETACKFVEQVVQANRHGQSCTKADVVLEMVLVKHESLQKSFIFSVVGPAGFEPATSSTRTRRSTKLSHGPKKFATIFGRSSLRNPADFDLAGRL